MFYRVISITALLLICFQSCRYNFDKDDKKLSDTYSVDDTLIFKNNKGNFDTIRITKKELAYKGLSEGYSGNPETCNIYYQRVPPGKKELVGFGGQSGDTVKLPNYRPIKCGYVLEPKKAPSAYINPINGIRIYSCDPGSDSLFSLSHGKVVAVEQIENEFVCVVKMSSTIYLYSNLESTPLKKGVLVKQGEYIGRIKPDEDTGIKQILLIIRKDNKVLNFQKHLTMICEREFRLFSH